MDITLTFSTYVKNGVAYFKINRTIICDFRWY